MLEPRLRAAVPADLPRIQQIRHGVAENRLLNPALVSDEEVVWYMAEAIFLVSEDADGVQGFCCVNHQTGYVWALFVMDGRQGKGHGSGLLDAGMARLRLLGHEQAFLSTGMATRAVGFYRARGWEMMGVGMTGEAVFRFWL